MHSRCFNHVEIWTPFHEHLVSGSHLFAVRAFLERRFSEPSMTHSCEWLRAREWRGRQEFTLGCSVTNKPQRLSLQRGELWSYTSHLVKSCPKQPQQQPQPQPQQPGVYPKSAKSFCLRYLSRWTSVGRPSQELPSGESSDDCARGGDTSSSRSLRPWPR